MEEKSDNKYTRGGGERHISDAALNLDLRGRV